MRRAVLVAAVALLALAAVLIARTVRVASRQPAVGTVRALAVDAAAVHRFARSLEHRTISHQDPGDLDAGAFADFRRYLEECFPRVHAELRRDVVAEHSLLFSWRGRDSDRPPAVLAAHMDVVPVEPGTEAQWTHPPFAGRIADGYVWGRGAMDDKASLFAILEAVETLLTEGFHPRRTTYLAFGHDEEVGGTRGATALVQLLRTRSVPAEYVLDEGLAVTEGVVPGVRAPVALVGVAEKGYLSLEMVVRGEGGHSSTPPAETPVGVLARAIHRLETTPPPAALHPVARQLFEFVAPEAPFGARLVLANLWLFGPLLERRLAATPAMNALVRTTTAPTVLEASIKDNVLPVRARAVVNFRIRPGDSIASVTEHVRRAVDDPRVTVVPFGPIVSEPSPASSVDARAFALLQQTIREVFPGAVVAPSLVLGATDARHFTAMSPNVYRFLPFRVRPEDLRRPHGVDERLAVSAYEDAVRFYAQLIRNGDEYGARLAPRL